MEDLQRRFGGRMFLLGVGIIMLLQVKIIWFLIGMTFYGIGVAIIYQLITKKKGPIKFSIIGFLAFILFIVLLIFLIK